MTWTETTQTVVRLTDASPIQFVVGYNSSVNGRFDGGRYKNPT